MATWRLSVNPGDNESAVVQATGVAVVTKNIELTVNTSPTLITDTNTVTGTRQITREEVLEGILKIRDFVLTQPWPPQAT